jgi:formate hydrogenlyase subunit 3/multisubunit Na+/H+ antiporter MnhD subunit
MIKTGIYGIIRALEFCSIPKLSTIYFVLILAIITALYGITYASVQKDIKKMLAYSSIENIGIIGIGFGVYLLATYYEYPIVALIALCGSFAHILNHSIFKELLFLSAGSVYIKTHTKNMELLGGLIKKMPLTALCFIIGGVSICALPPFNGFVSEFLIYMSFIKALDITNFGVFIVILFAFASLALVGTIAILCFTKTISMERICMYYLTIV